MAPELLGILARHASLWKKLRRQSIVVTATRNGEGACYRDEDLASQARLLERNGVSAAVLAQLCGQLKRMRIRLPCIVDLAQAAALVKRQKLKPAAAIERARVRYQGTDGVRGRVMANQGGNPIEGLVQRGEFSAGLVELLCVAWLEYARARVGEICVIAEDGRDCKSRVMVQAAIRAARRYGLRVFDLGIAPTPLVPVAQAQFQARLGLTITASHNPADQNGIKFFIDGRKLMPDPDDLVVSALAFIFALEGLPRERGGAIKRVDPAPLLKRFFRSALTPVEIKHLRSASFVIDAAHGAFGPSLTKLLAGLGLRSVVLNADVSGDNINRDSGVAHLEGKETVAAKELDSEIKIVGEVYRQAQSGGAPVFGIGLDGDGDRGLLLVADKQNEAVGIVDGDRAAYLLAQSSLPVRGKVFAGTVESDLSVFRAVEDLGLKTTMTPVGDKWLSSVPALARKLLVGEEASGHLVWPVRVGGQNVVAGNGLLSGLRVAAAIMKLNLSMAKAAEPYAPGVIKTFYTYFVDRARFYRGGPVWQQDLKTAVDELRRLKREKLLPPSARFKALLFRDDPDMLYLNLIQDGPRVIGAIFARNSGTENKTATYARGDANFAAPLIALARALNQNHVRLLKDERLCEARAGADLVKALAATKQLSLLDARQLVEKAGISEEAGFHALLFAMQKEGSLRRVGERLEGV